MTKEEKVEEIKFLKIKLRRVETTHRAPMILDKIKELEREVWFDDLDIKPGEGLISYIERKDKEAKEEWENMSTEEKEKRFRDNMNAMSCNSSETFLPMGINQYEAMQNMFKNEIAKKD